MDVNITERNERSALLLLCILFLTMRLPGLLAPPLFNDEAVYLLRAQHFPAQFLFTIRDGKLRAYPNNPAARKAIKPQAKWRKAR